MDKQMYELRKAGNSVSSVAKLSVKLQVMGDIEPENFPEAKDVQLTIGLLEALEILGDKVTELVDEMEARAVQAATAEADNIHRTQSFSDYIKRRMQPKEPEDKEIVANICPRCYGELQNIHDQLVCINCTRKEHAKQYEAQS